MNRSSGVGRHDKHSHPSLIWMLELANELKPRIEKSIIHQRKVFKTQEHVPHAAISRSFPTSFPERPTSLPGGLATGGGAQAALSRAGYRALAQGQEIRTILSPLKTTEMKEGFPDAEDRRSLNGMSE